MLTLLRGWRWAVVVALSAMVNPVPSPAPMILQALALVGLLLTVGTSALREATLRRRPSRAAAMATSTG